MVTAAVQYDALGRRVEKDVDSDVERYIYSGYETVSVYDEDENTSEVTRSFYHRNALGSVMAITEMDEDVAVEYRYAPYGQVTITRNATPQASDPLNEEAGRYYYRARYYSPETGRFLQRDLLGYADGPNVYEYVRSGPISHADPVGTRTVAVAYKPGEKKQEIKDNTRKALEKHNEKQKDDADKIPKGIIDKIVEDMGEPHEDAEDEIVDGLVFPRLQFKPAPGPRKKGFLCRRISVCILHVTLGRRRWTTPTPEHTRPPRPGRGRRRNLAWRSSRVANEHGGCVR